MTTVATPDEYQQIVDYLARQGQVRSAWMIREVWWSLHRGGHGDRSVVVHRRGGEVAGVATVLCGSEPGGEPSDGCGCRMEADDAEAVQALLSAFPPGGMGFINTHSPRVRAALDQVAEYECYPAGPLMTVTPEQFRPVLAEGIREVTESDASLFAGLEQPLWDCEGEPGGRHFALLHDGQALSYATWIPLTLEPVFSPPLIRITYIATAETHRRQGLGRQVLSYVTDLVLRAGGRPMYWTSLENIPSQGLAKHVGYEEVGRLATYEWRETEGG